MEEIEKLKKETIKKLSKINDLRKYENLRALILGRKGKVAELFSKIRVVAKEKRGEFGAALNELKNELTTKFEKKYNDIKKANIKFDKYDLTRDSFPSFIGAIHPLNKTYIEIVNIFRNLGFTVVEGPEIEDEFHNFEGLNFPKDHPARDAQDSFFLEDGNLLRTHTTPVQIRILKKWTPPFAVISPGKCYRRDTIDASHSSMFNQIDGFLVDENVSVADLKGTLNNFIREIFGSNTKSRFRPHFFPFTEPSMEVDIECIFCQGKGCNVCKHTGWIEILGSGMIDPEVFKKCRIDPKRYTGFAFGMGIERITMLRQSIDDMRYFFENDVKFLRQFR
jgi:phenylalanyl-tRNA synthetase alpha chain